jgi:cyclic pyranopterin phosphate synthase
VLPGVGPARYVTTPNGARLGIIAAVTERFCDSCNRIRVSARGLLHTCLGMDDDPSDNAIDLRAALREGPAQVHDALRRALSRKAEGHTFTLSERSLAGGPRRHMLVIGG